MYDLQSFLSSSRTLPTQILWIVCMLSNVILYNGCIQIDKGNTGHIEVAFTVITLRLECGIEPCIYGDSSCRDHSTYRWNGSS